MADGRLVRVKLKFERDYTQIPNEWIRDPQLSLRARGLLALLMSHKEGFTVTHKQLVATNPEGLAAIQSAVDELKRGRYLVVNKERGRGGRITGWVWELTDPAEEKRRSTPHLDLPDLDTPDLAEPYLDNPHLKEPHREEHLTKDTQPDHSTRAGMNEDAFGGSQPVATLSVEQSFERDLHARCSWFSKSNRECDWAPSGYCQNCGRARPSLVPEAVSA